MKYLKTQKDLERVSGEIYRELVDKLCKDGDCTYKIVGGIKVFRGIKIEIQEDYDATCAFEGDKVDEIRRIINLYKENYANVRYTVEALNVVLRQTRKTVTKPFVCVYVTLPM